MSTILKIKVRKTKKNNQKRRIKKKRMKRRVRMKKWLMREKEKSDSKMINR